MAEDPEGMFVDWELESSISSELKRQKQLSAPQRRYYNLCRRKVRFVSKMVTISDVQ